MAKAPLGFPCRQLARYPPENMPFPETQKPPTSEVLPFGLVLNRASDYPCHMSDECYGPNQGG